MPPEEDFFKTIFICKRVVRKKMTNPFWNPLSQQSISELDFAKSAVLVGWASQEDRGLVLLIFVSYPTFDYLKVNEKIGKIFFKRHSKLMQLRTFVPYAQLRLNTPLGQFNWKNMQIISDKILAWFDLAHIFIAWTWLSKETDIHLNYYSNFSVCLSAFLCVCPSVHHTSSFHQSSYSR